MSGDVAAENVSPEKFISLFRLAFSVGILCNFAGAKECGQEVRWRGGGGQEAGNWQ